MTASTPTRDRILDAAMELFSENGFRGTSITQIETAVGLTRGGGGIYHHFRTKEAVLEAGIARNLERLSALRDIKDLLAGSGDLRIELTILARYALGELDREQTLLRIIAGESRSRPHLVNEAVEHLVRSTFSDFAGWLVQVAGVPATRADSIAAVAWGALLSARLIPIVFGIVATEIDDEQFVRTWVAMVLDAVGHD